MSQNRMVASSTAVLVVLTLAGCAPTTHAPSSLPDSDAVPAAGPLTSAVEEGQLEEGPTTSEVDRVASDTAGQDETVTGSRLPRKAVDGPQRVIVIDQEEIRSTGALNVTDVLRRTGNNF